MAAPLDAVRAVDHGQDHVAPFAIQDPAAAAPVNADRRWLTSADVVVAFLAGGVLLGSIMYFVFSMGFDNAHREPPLWVNRPKICLLGTRDLRYYDKAAMELTQHLGTEFAKMLDSGVPAELVTAGNPNPGIQTVESDFRDAFKKPCATILEYPGMPKEGWPDPASSDIAEKFKSECRKNDCFWTPAEIDFRHFVIGLSCDYYVLVGGGPGVAISAGLARRRQVPVIPAWGSGGASASELPVKPGSPEWCKYGLFPAKEKPDIATPGQWHEIKQKLTVDSALDVAEMIVEVVRGHIMSRAY